MKDVLVFSLLIPVLLLRSWLVGARRRGRRGDRRVNDRVDGRRRRIDGRTLRRAALAIAVVLLALAPFALGSFAVSLLNDIGIGALVALGLVLLTGIGGATSFGQAAFVGVAAYATAWLTTVHGASPWLGLVFALALTGPGGARDRPLDLAPGRPLPAAQHHRLGPVDSAPVRQPRSARQPQRPGEHPAAAARAVAAARAARHLLPDLGAGRCRLLVQPQPAALACRARHPQPARRCDAAGQRRCRRVPGPPNALRHAPPCSPAWPAGSTRT